MSALIPANFGQVAPVFAGANANDDLSSGIQSSFGLIGYKGKVWSIRYRGEDTPLMREDGDGAKGSIEVIILAASKAVSKVFYKDGYVEGSTAAPDCFSNNGVTPDPASAAKQCDTCALCPHNQWGSRVSQTSSKGKACADSKRLAVVPMQDIENEVFGGPMLLRVPAASLQDLAQYGVKMNQLGYPYYSIATRIAFDTAESYPKFVFSAIRPLNNEEGQIVLAARTGHHVERILSENEFAAPPAPQQSDVNSAFEQPPETESKPTTSANTSVGDQARAAADATKADAAAKKAAADKKKADAAARKAAMEAELAAAEAEANAAAQPEETEEERELREMEEKLAALKAKKSAAAAPEKTVAQSQATSVAHAATDETVGTGSDFEADLDAMLDQLMPSS